MLNLFLKRTILVRLFVMAFLFLFVFSNHKEAIFLMAASPTVTTSAASSISKTTATLNGVVSDNGGEFVTETGFEYGLTNTYGSSVVSSALYSFDFLFAGTSGSAEGQFNGAYWMDIDSSGNIYISDSVNNRIQKFDSSGNFLMMFGWGVDDGSSVFQTCVSGCQAGILGAGSGQFNVPIGITLDSSNNIYVADTQNNRIQKFDSSGNFLRTFGFGVETGASTFEVCTTVCQAGVSGNGSGQMDDPLGLATDASDDIYVTDYLNHRVQKFDSDGGVLPGGFGSSGTAEAQFNRPLGIAIDQSSGDIFVGEHFNHRIQKFNSSGVFQRMFGWGVDDGSSVFQTCVSGCQAGTSNSGNGGLNQPFGLGVDLSGNVYVADAGNDRVQKFTSLGAYVSKFGTSGTGNGQFGLPVHLVIDGAGDLHVSDFTNNKIQKFTILDIDPIQITGLACGTTYHFRAYAENTDGTSYGNDTTFTTSACEVPEVDTVSATNISQNSAVLNGLYVDMPFPGLTRGFEYGPTTSYGTTVSENGNESVSSFGSAGSGNGEFDTPMGISLTPAEDALYVVDQANSRVQKLTTSGTHILNIVGNGIAFSSPSNVYVDTNGKVYVADVGNNRVQRFASDGTFELEIGTGLFGTKFTVAVDSSGNIFVADYDNALVAKFDSLGNSLANFADGQHANPLSIDFDSSGNVYVGDGGFGTVRVFDSSGVFISEIISDIAGVFNNYIDIDSADNLYVKDYDNGKLYKHDSSDALVYTLLSAPGYFSTVDSSGNIYVADTDNNNIDIYNLNFSRDISSLGCENTYHFRAFATNADGTGYGDDMTFNTDDCGPTSGGGDDEGCTDPTADNYDPDAEDDDGSCLYFGCMDRDASNFDSTANVPVDDYCIYDPGAIPGCTDQNAGNYNSSATVDDGSCLYGVFGCMDPLANNYNLLAEYSNGSCTYDDGPPVGSNGGCTVVGAINYNPNADYDDGTCSYTIPLIYGCIDISALNFDSNANTDDGSCEYIGAPDENPISQIIGVVSGVAGNVPKEILTGVSVIGIVGPGIILNFLQPGLLAGLISIPIRLWNLIPVLMGYKRKKRPWGTVFDSVTKQPLDPVYVTLSTLTGVEQGTSITDLDGRYGFLAEAGSYKISANKDNYIFPSTKLAGKTADELYDSLYFGESIELTEKEGVIYKNIPMDSINFNWNEFAKAKNKKLMKFYSKRDLFFARIAKTLFITGLLCSLILFIVDNSLLNTVILSLYALILVLRIFGVKPKQSGYAYDTDGTPLSYGIIKLFSSELNREVGHTVIGKTGRYYMLAPNGNYYMKVFRKTDETSYEDILITDTFRVKGGYVRKVIRA